MGRAASANIRGDNSPCVGEPLEIRGSAAPARGRSGPALCTAPAALARRWHRGGDRPRHAARGIVLADRLGHRQWPTGSGNLTHQTVMLLTAAPDAIGVLKQVFKTGQNGLARGQIWRKPSGNISRRDRAKKVAVFCRPPEYSFTGSGPDTSDGESFIAKPQFS